VLKVPKNDCMADRGAAANLRLGSTTQAAATAAIRAAAAAASHLYPLQMHCMYAPLLMSHCMLQVKKTAMFSKVAGSSSSAHSISDQPTPEGPMY
jgi:hypothetical protein